MSEWRFDLVPFLTAIAHVCLLYATLGIHTCDKETAHV